MLRLRLRLRFVLVFVFVLIVFLTACLFVVFMVVLGALGFMVLPP